MLIKIDSSDFFPKNIFLDKVRLSSLFVQLTLALSFVALLSPRLAEAHDKEQRAAAPKEVAAQPQQSTAIVEINTAYRRDIKPLFRRACMDCHSNETHFPWYAKIPGVAQFIQHHIDEGREHLDISYDFPFQGHGRIDKDLKEILETLQEGEMPPSSYLLMHQEARLSKEEKAKIEHWITDSLKLLGVSQQ